MNNFAEASHCQPLIEACTLDIYQKNVFRVTDLPVDATSKEIARHAQKLQMLQEMGGSGISSRSAFPLDPAATSEQIRGAMARIKEPQDRLIDEFFWFWPTTFGEGRNDPAIQAFLDGDVLEASTLWTKQEQEGSLTAVHNLAVLDHFTAVCLTHTQLRGGIDITKDSEIKKHWRKSFERWEQLIDSEPFWEMLKSRIILLEDEALTIGFVRRMRMVLPMALDRINAEAALKFAEQKRMDWAEYHVDFMRQTHQGIDDVESISELVLSPTKRRLQQRLVSVRKQIEQNPELGREATTDLLAHCRPLMDLFTLFHGKGSHQRSDLFDDVARTATEILISYQKATGDNQSLAELLRKALEFATDTQLRLRIIENIAIGEKNLANSYLGPFFSSMEKITSGGETPEIKFQKLRSTILPQLPELTPGLVKSVYDDLMDSVALALRQIAIDAHNTHKDFETAESASQLALKFSITPDLQQKLRDDILLLAKNKKDATCFFCEAQPSDQKFVHQVKMHGDVIRSSLAVNYKKISVSVPSCEECSKKRNKLESGGCSIALACWAICILAGWELKFLTGSFILGGIGSLVIWLVVREILTIGIKNAAHHPEVKKMLKAGWNIGEAPAR